MVSYKSYVNQLLLFTFDFTKIGLWDQALQYSSNFTLIFLNMVITLLKLINKWLTVISCPVNLITATVSIIQKTSQLIFFLN